MSRSYLLMIFGLLFLIFPLITGSFLIDKQMGQDKKQEALTHKETSTWSRMPNAKDQMHAERLCDGYLTLLKFGGDKGDKKLAKSAYPAKITPPEKEAPPAEVKPTAKVAPPAQVTSPEKVASPAQVTSPEKVASPASNKKYIGPFSALLIKTDARGKESVNDPNIKYDATDDRSEARPQCMARRPLKKKEKGKKSNPKEKVKGSSDQKSFNENRTLQIKNIEKLKEKASVEKSKTSTKKYKEKAAVKPFPAIRKNVLKNKEKPKGKGFTVSSVTLLNWGEPDNGLKAPSSFKPLPMDARSQRISELNRIYTDYLKAWESPFPRNMLQTRTSSNFSGVALTALIDLLNILEHYQQGNLVKDLAEKISQEMEPNLPKQINQEAHLVSDSRASLKGIITNDLSGLFENVSPSNASTAFKQLLADIKSRRSQIQAGKLYDEYKKGFCKIFKDHKRARKSDIDTEIQPSESVECYGKKKSNLKALEFLYKVTKKKEVNGNGGSNPYYMPMAKDRQLVHNDIPLIKPSKKEYNSLDKEKPGEYNDKDFSQQDTTNLKKKVEKLYIPEPYISPGKELYSGLDSELITNGLKAIKNASFYNLLDEYQKQVESLNQALRNKQDWWMDVKEKDKSSCPRSSKRNNHRKNAPFSKTPKRKTRMNNPGPMLFPEVLLNQPPQMSPNVLGNMARQMNVSPVEMAQRIVGAGQAAPSVPAVHHRLTVPHMQISSQLGGCTVPKVPDNMCNIPCQPQDLQQQQQQQQQQQHPQQQQEISPVLDKILQRLEAIQATKCNKSEEEEEQKKLPCCFEDPADGTPCDLNGSWESIVLGIRINIKSQTLAIPDQRAKPTCIQRKNRHALFDDHHQRLRRQCVKKDPIKLKQISDLESKSLGIPLNVSVQETTPPRAHDLLDNLPDWQFSGNAQMLLGGPISLSFRKNNSNLIGHFVGYCRNCGCMDTIFGSWTFCQPSRDCQDIFTSIVDRRDMLRRYSMDERRKNRYKEQLFLGSKFAKMEAERLRSEQAKQNDAGSKANTRT